MKKSVFFLSAVAIMLCVFAAAFPAGAISAETVDSDNDSAAYRYWHEFVSLYPDRVAGTAGETAAALYIKQQFEGLNFTDVKEDIFTVYNEDGKTSLSRNIIATKTFVGNTQRVIIGAHFDNAGYGDGAYDNGSGVAVLLALAERFSAVQSLPFNLTFVAFGAEEQGLIGASYYVQDLSQAEKDGIILMINLDVVGYGDFNYVYGEDIANPQEKYFANISNNLNHENAVKEMPVNMGTMSGSGIYRPYYNVGHASDHFMFLEAGIPVAFFFSGNFKSGYFGYQERVKDGKINNIMHTSNDNINYIEAHKAAFVKNLETVTDTVFEGVTAEGFSAAMKDARDYIVSPFWLNALYARIALFLLAAGLAAGGFYYYRRLQKQAILGTAEVRVREVRKPPEEDIFKFGK